MVDSGTYSPIGPDLWLAPVSADGRVTIPVPLVSKLLWLDTKEEPVDCLAILMQAGHMIVTPMSDADGDVGIQALLVQRQPEEGTSGSILSTNDPTEIGRRLRIMSMRITLPPPSVRLRIPQSLFPLMGLTPKGGLVYLFESGGRLKVTSVGFAEEQVANWPVDLSDLT